MMIILLEGYIGDIEGGVIRQAFRQIMSKRVRATYEQLLELKVKEIRDETLNPFVFVENDAINQIDVFGLHSMKYCEDEFQKWIKECRSLGRFSKRVMCRMRAEAWRAGCIASSDEAIGCYCVGGAVIVIAGATATTGPGGGAAVACAIVAQ